MSTHPEKKSERMEVRLGYSEKQAFVEACDVQGDTPSGAVRRFISGYTRRSTDDVMGEANRRLWRRYGMGAGIFAGVAAAFVVAATIWPLGGVRSAPDAEAVFVARDLDGDGLLSKAELKRPEGADRILRVLDLDSSGTIDRAEFVPTGHMAYQVMDAERAAQAKAAGVADPRMSVVRFTMLEDHTELSRYDGAVINAGGLDRLVVWDVHGVPTVLNGNVTIRSDKDMELQADSAFVGKPMTLKMAAPAE